MKTGRVAAIALMGGALAWTGVGGAAAQDLVVGLGANVTSIDPHFHNLSPNSNVAQHVFNSLIHQDDKQRLVPGLATEWKAVDDTTWEFKLRQGVKFHDGSSFDAEDVVATLKRVPWVPNSPSSFALYTRAVKEAVVVDPHTIRFKTAAPYPLLPVDLSSVFIVNRKMVEAPTVDFNSGKAAIGTGPFRFVEYKPGDRIVLQRNEGYWGQKPHWANVSLRLMTNNATRVSALLSGDVQFIEQVPTADVKNLATNQNVAISRVVGNRVIYLHLDSFRDQTPQITDKAGQPLEKNPLKDVRVRKALNKAVNRQAIVERLMEGEAIPAGGLLAEGFFGVSPKLKPEPFDQEGARKLLAEAGYPNGFTMTIHGPNDRYVNDEKVLQAVGAMFTRVGIDTKVVAMPWATYAGQSSAPAFSFSVMLVGWGAGTGEMSSPLRSLIATPNREKGMGFSNRGRYSTPKVDEILFQALATVDDGKRDKLLQEASELAMLTDAALVPLHYQIKLWAARKGLVYTPRADEFTLAHELRPAK